MNTRRIVTLGLTIALASLVRADESRVTSFRDALAKLAADAREGVVVGKDGWRFLPAELRHVSVGEFWGDASAKVSNAPKKEHADPLPAIVDFKRQLDESGIQLIVVPVPPKVVVYPDQLVDGVTPTPRLDTAHEQFLELLKTNGVDSIDLTPALLALRQRETAFCKTDSHFSGAACVEIAKLIAEKVKDKPARKLEPVEAWKEQTISGDLGKGATETIRLRFVGTGNADAPTPVKPDPASSVVLLGDSHTLVFHAGGDMHVEGAGLADQLVKELGVAIDLVGVRGSGATPARVNLMRAARADAGYLAGKKTVIWCFTAREYTEGSGWMKVPLLKK